MKTSRPLLAALLLICAAPFAHADESAAPAAATADGNWCAQHPERCEQAKQRLKAKCDADPAKCEEMKAKMQEKAAECEAHPEQCRDQRRAKLEEACKNNPQRPICKRLGSAPASP